MKCPSCSHKYDPFTFDIPKWLDPEAWHHWLEYRKKFKEPFTDRAKKLAVNKLDGLRKQGYDPGEVIDYCIDKPWRGIFEPKELAQKATIAREKKHEAEKRVYEIKRKPPVKVNTLEARNIRKEMCDIARGLANYSTAEALIAKSRLKALKADLLALTDGSIKLGAIING